MPTPLRFSPLPDDEPPLDLPVFLHRLKLESAFAEKMRAHYETALALPLTPETEESHASTPRPCSPQYRVMTSWEFRTTRLRLVQAASSVASPPEGGDWPIFRSFAASSGVTANC